MDYVTLLQKYAKEKENTPYLILKDRQVTYGQAYEDVRGFVAPEWEQQFPVLSRHRFRTRMPAWAC